MATLGIDFGTTKTMAAWVNPKTGHQEVINLGEEHNYIPTTVFLDRGGSMYFGDEADDLAADAPDRYARGFKMKLGSGGPALMCFQDGRPCTYTARQLTAAFLRHVRKLCEERACFGSVDAAVITRPVNFSPAQVEDLRLAAEEAGFREVTFITEPEAAGYAFCRLSPESAFHGNALIVDWGGGTLDMSIVERAGDKVKTDRTRVSGENMMGGEMFDAYLWQYVISCLSGKGTDLNIQPAAVIHQAQVQVRKAKESLSKRDSKDLRFATSSGSTPPVPVRRADFESLIGQDVQKAAGMARQLVQQTKQAGCKPEMLLLVGGTSLIPLVRSQMESQTGLPARQWQYTREAVAIGAALWQNMETSSPKNAQFYEDSHAGPLSQPSDSNESMGRCDQCEALRPQETHENDIELNSKQELNDVWVGTCTNLTHAVTVPLTLVLEQCEQNIRGRLMLGGDRLVGSGDISGTCHDGRIYFESPGGSFLFKHIEWTGTVDENRIDGTYRVVPRAFVEVQTGVFSVTRSACYPPMFVSWDSPGLRRKVELYRYPFQVSAGSMLEVSTIPPNAHVFYTTDGTAPSSHSLRYTGPVSLPSSCRIVKVLCYTDTIVYRPQSYFTH